MYGILNKPNIDPFKPRVIKTSIECGVLLDENTSRPEITTESLSRWLTGDTERECYLTDVPTEHWSFSILPVGE